jgi:hypothetical protein
VQLGSDIILEIVVSPPKVASGIIEYETLRRCIIQGLKPTPQTSKCVVQSILLVEEMVVILYAISYKFNTHEIVLIY